MPRPIRQSRLLPFRGLRYFLRGVRGSLLAAAQVEAAAEEPRSDFEVEPAAQCLVRS